MARDVRRVVDDGGGAGELQARGGAVALVREARSGSLGAVDRRNLHHQEVLTVVLVEVAKVGAQLASRELTMVERNRLDHVRLLVRTGVRRVGEHPQSGQQRHDHEARPPHSTVTRPQSVDHRLQC